MTSCLSVSMYSNFLFIEVFYLLLTVLFVGTFVAYILLKKKATQKSKTFWKK